VSLVPIVLGSIAVLAAAYFLYGGLLARLFRLNPHAPTPANTLRDDVDFVPIGPQFLFGQQLSAIAAAGPIVGPILAGIMFGWLPALLWIVIGSIFIGGVHDFASLVASVRHKARSIAEVVREYMTRRSYLLFLAFVWIALVYVVVSFTDIVAGSFVGKQVLENGQLVSGGAIASSSLLYLVLPVMMGLLLRYARLPLLWATVIFLPLVGLAIWAGRYIPLDLSALLGTSDVASQKIWAVALLAYCYVASLVPMWLLLQPRGHLGGFFLMFAMVGGLVGLVLGGHPVAYPAFTGWVWQAGGGAASPLMPLLFITIACGACSGFHSIITSGTTSKQLRSEMDARPVAYGAMLTEALVAVVSLGCLMMLTAPAARALAGKPNLIYAQGLGVFLERIHVPVTFGISFGLLAFTTFVYDTLDVCTRLGRYIVVELTGWRGRSGKVFATALTIGVPLVLVMQTMHDASGNVIPAWRVFWSLFGASNQLLAALGLLGITVWLMRTYHARWVLAVTGLPCVWMYVMSGWALLRFVGAGFFPASGGVRLPAEPVPWVALVLVVLAGLMLVEAGRVLARSRTRSAAAA
jgi:carbon starvation protein